MTTAQNLQILKFGQTFTLASQEGRRGRPRASGRVYVFVSDSHKPGVAYQARKAVAAFYGKPTSAVVHYDYERDASCLSFRVKGLARDLGATFSLREG